MDPFLPDDQKVAAVRALLPATGAGIYLDATSAGPLPAETDRALREADDWELRVGRGGPDHAPDAELRREEARGVVAAALGMTPDRVIAAMGLRAVVGSVLAALEPARPALVLRPGLDGAVSAVGSIVAATRGWAVVTDGETGAVHGGPATGGALEPGGHIRGGLVLTPAMRADDGVPVDLVALAARVHADGGMLVVDLTLAAGAIDLALAATGADAAVLGTDRWLLAPDGTAAAWLAPTLGPKVMDRAAGLSDPMPRRAALGLARSVGWLLMYVGLPWAVARAGTLAARLRGSLVGIAGVELRDPATADRRSPTIVFGIRDWSADDAAEELGRRVFAIVGRSPDGAALRVGVGAWNTEAELDRFAAAVAELAAHTPDTLPRRSPLVVLGGG